jgi:hypothetical protein
MWGVRRRQRSGLHDDMQPHRPQAGEPRGVAQRRGRCGLCALREGVISFARGRVGRWKRWVEETERGEGGRTETEQEKERKKQPERHKTVPVPDQTKGTQVSILCLCVHPAIVCQRLLHARRRRRRWWSPCCMSRKGEAGNSEVVVQGIQLFGQHPPLRKWHEVPCRRQWHARDEKCHGSSFVFPLTSTYHHHLHLHFSSHLYNGANISSPHSSRPSPPPSCAWSPNPTCTFCTHSIGLVRRRGKQQVDYCQCKCVTALVRISY